MANLSTDLRAAIELLNLRTSRGGKIIACSNASFRALAEQFVMGCMETKDKARTIESKTLSRLQHFFPKQYHGILSSLEQAVPVISLTPCAIASGRSSQSQYALSQQLYFLSSPNDVLVLLTPPYFDRDLVNVCQMAKVKEIPTIVLAGKFNTKPITKKRNIITPKIKIFFLLRNSFLHLRLEKNLLATLVAFLPTIFFKARITFGYIKLSSKKLF